MGVGAEGMGLVPSDPDLGYNLDHGGQLITDPSGSGQNNKYFFLEFL